MRAFFPILFALALVSIFCGYSIVAETNLDHSGASIVPGMRTTASTPSPWR